MHGKMSAFLSVLWILLVPLCVVASGTSQGTTWWPIQVFAFFVVCTEVSAYLAMKYFLKIDDTLRSFGENFAKALINNSYMNNNTYGSPENSRKRKISHILETDPLHMLLTFI